MNPFKRIDSRVQEDHKEFRGYPSAQSLREVLGEGFKMFYFRLQRHRSECPLCTCPRWYAFGRWCARTWQRIHTRLP